MSLPCSRRAAHGIDRILKLREVLPRMGKRTFQRAQGWAGEKVRSWSDMRAIPSEDLRCSGSGNGASRRAEGGG